MMFRFGPGRLNAKPKPTRRTDLSVYLAFLDATGRNGHKAAFPSKRPMRPENGTWTLKLLPEIALGFASNVQTKSKPLFEAPV
jgi:hypothetical protein